MPQRGPVLPDQKTLVKPDDFAQFWRDTLEELKRYNSDYEASTVESRGGITHTAVDFNSWLDTGISGYFLHWDDEQPRPLVIYTHGYYGQCDIQWQWAEQGLNVFGFDTRGFGRSAFPSHADGWILTGIESPQTSIIRGAVCDYMRAADIARRMTRVASSRVLYYGYSFGGAMALVAEAVSQTADLVVAGVPSLGWMAGRRVLVQSGSGGEVNRCIDSHPEMETQIMRTLSYFDTANFADMIDKPVLIGIGCEDFVVPAQTVRAICARLHCPHVIREFPHSHSSEPDESLWQNFEQEWIQMALTGMLPSI